MICFCKNSIFAFNTNEVVYVLPLFRVWRELRGIILVGGIQIGKKRDLGAGLTGTAKNSRKISVLIEL
jgi:hypothetical protein